MADARELTLELLAAGLLEPADVFDADLSMQETAHLNAGTLVRSGAGRSMFVKHFDGSHGPDSLRLESALYRSPILTASVPMPRLLHADIERQYLVLESIGDGKTLREMIHTDPAGSTAFAPGLARSLASIHELDQDFLPVPETQKRLPWILTLLPIRPAGFHQWTSAGHELLRLMNREQIPSLLDDVRSNWSTSHFIHGDLRLDNVLVDSSAHAGQVPDIRVIDWEFAGTGDPAWDAATVFAEMLDIWVQSIPLAHDQPLDTYMHRATIPLADLQPALRSFWHTYADATSADRDCLTKASYFTGARLFQTAFERTQGMMSLSPDILLLLQLGLNVLQRPGEACTHLLGITLP